VLTIHAVAGNPAIHFFNTFFYSKLNSKKSGYTYKDVRRWTDKTKSLKHYAKTDGILGCERWVVPIHLADHWVLGVVHVAAKRIEVLDSLGGKHDGAHNPYSCAACLPQQPSAHAPLCHH
jgi:Ulp1 family protease